MSKAHRPGHHHPFDEPILAARPTQVLPADDPDFEAAARRACQLVLARDPRIGKTPRTRSIRGRNPRRRRQDRAG